MKISVFHNQQSTSILLARELRKKLLAAGNSICESDPELVVTVGGDGTLLAAFHRYAHKLNELRFVGVHTGHLGFYTDWRDYELDELVESLSNDQGESVSYPLLDIKISYQDVSRDTQHFLALNESTIKRMNSTMVTDVYIKDELFERFRGDGLSISTPTGSTAYNKSAGGAVLHPRINALQLTEIASLNNRVYRTLGSPLIIASDEWIRIEISEEDEYLVTVDQLNLHQSNIAAIQYKIAAERIHFASYRHTHFWRRVKDAFIGEL